MVTTTTANHVSKVKIDAKVPVSKIEHHNKLNIDLQVPVSPNSQGSLEDEVLALRARNKILTEALKAVNETANKKFKKNYDLVWYARNRCRYPSHEASKRIEESEEHKEDLNMLRSTEADYHHGFHAGVLASSRMFKEQSDILHINKHEELNDKLMGEASKHFEKVKEAQKKFERRKSLPQVTENEFPVQE